MWQMAARSDAAVLQHAAPEASRVGRHISRRGGEATPCTVRPRLPHLVAHAHGAGGAAVLREITLLLGCSSARARLRSSTAAVSGSNRQ